MQFGHAASKPAARVFTRRLALLGLVLFSWMARAEDLSFTNLLAQGVACDEKHESHTALNYLQKAEPLCPTNGQMLFLMAKQYCDLMHGATSKEKKEYAAQALAYSQRAALADPESSRAHVCVAVGYAKNFPFIDNEKKVAYSREIKKEAEKAIALDPKADLPYHMLGRWNCEVANMSFLLKGVVKLAYGGLPKASNEQAVENFEKAISLAPGRIIHHLQLAHVYHLMDKDKLAAPELKICLGLAPLDLEDTDALKIARKVSDTGHWPSVF